MTTQGTGLATKTMEEIKRMIDDKDAWNALEDIRAENDRTEKVLGSIDPIRMTRSNMSPFSFSKRIHNMTPVRVSSLIQDMFYAHLPYRDKMTRNTIQSVIERTMDQFETVFMDQRDTFFAKTELIQSDYDNSRLFYLMENQEEPSKVYSMSEYDYITEKVCELVYKLSIEFFEEGYIRKTVLANLLNQYYNDMYKCFDTVHESVIEVMWDYFITKVKEDTLTEQDIYNYRENKGCLITHCIDSVDVFLERASSYQNISSLVSVDAVAIKKSELHNNVKIYAGYFEMYIQHWDLVQTLLSKENIEWTINKLTAFMKALLHLSNVHRDDFTDIGIFVYNFLHKAKSFVEERNDEYHKTELVMNFIEELKVPGKPFDAFD